MAITDWGHPSGIIPRSNTALDSPGQIRLRSYVDSNGVETGDVCRQVRLYNATGGALVAGATYMVDFDGDEETNPKVIACAAVTVDVQVVIAQEATATASWGWFTYAGYCDALVEGTTDVAKDDYLKIVAGTSATSFIKDGTARTSDSGAIATAAQTANSSVLTKVFLLGDRFDID